MNIISWIIFGTIVGFLVNLLTGKDNGCFGSIFVGIVGSFVGGTLLTFFRTGNFDITADAGFSLESIIVSVIGAVLFLAIMKAVRN